MGDTELNSLHYLRKKKKNYSRLLCHDQMGDGIKHGDEEEVRGDWQERVGAKRKMKWKNIS